MGKASLRFMDHNHDLEKIMGAAASGPKIVVKAEDMEHVGTHHITLRDVGPNHKDDTVVLYKHENKYIVLLGKKLALSQLGSGNDVTGKLISKPALKKCRIVFIPESERAVSSARRSFNRTY